MNRRQQREMIAGALAGLVERVDRLRSHKARPDYSQLTDDELRLLTELSRKAHGSPELADVDLVACDRPGHGLGSGKIDDLAAQPFDLAHLSPPELAEFERLVAKIEPLPP